MVVRGGIDLVGQYRNAGYSGQRLKTAVEKVFPGGLSQSIDALIRRGSEVRNVTAAAERQRGPGALPTPSFVTNEFIGSTYRYTYKLPYSIDGVSQRPMLLVYDSDSQATLENILEDAIRVGSLLLDNDISGYPVDEESTVVTGQPHIIKIERGR